MKGCFVLIFGWVIGSADGWLHPHMLSAQPITYSQRIEWPNQTFATFNLRRYEPVELAVRSFAWRTGPRNDIPLLSRAVRLIVAAAAEITAPPPHVPAPLRARIVSRADPKRLGVLFLIQAGTMTARGSIVPALLSHGELEPEDVVGVECGTVAADAAGGVPVNVTVHGQATDAQCVELGLRALRSKGSFDLIWILSSALHFDGSIEQLIKLKKTLEQAMINHPTLGAVSAPVVRMSCAQGDKQCSAPFAAQQQQHFGCTVDDGLSNVIRKRASVAHLGVMLSASALAAVESEGGSLVPGSWIGSTGMFVEFFSRLRHAGWAVGCTPSTLGVLMQSAAGSSSHDLALAEWSLSGRFGSFWPQVLGHDDAGTQQLQLWQRQQLQPAVSELPDDVSFRVAAQVEAADNQATVRWRHTHSWQPVHTPAAISRSVWTFDVSAGAIVHAWRALQRVAVAPEGFDSAFFSAGRFSEGRATLREYPDYQLLTQVIQPLLNKLGYLNTTRRQNDVLSSTGWATFGAKVSMDRWKLNTGDADSFSNRFVEFLKVGSGSESNGSSIEGFFYYPQGAYREWHTNEDDQLGWRMYLVHTKSLHCAWFRYRDPLNGKIYTSEDGNYTVRLFKIVRDAPLWHSIESQCDRWSVGVHLRITDQAVAMLLRWLGFHSDHGVRP